MASSYTSNNVVQVHLRHGLQEIEKKMDCDCLSYVGPIAFGADDAIRDAVEGIDNKKAKLVFMLETAGGFAETARRIADTLRHHYQVVDFLVPSYAMSAGTILVMSGDAIHMDYYSVLGPVDPQVEDSNGRLVPALGYLIRYQALLAKANAGKISTAEMEILLSFDQMNLYAYEQARDLSRALLEEWLVKYKFKDWSVTETNKTPVTQVMKVERAREIADKLNEPTFWNSHGIGINKDRLTNMLKLKIDDFGLNVELSKEVRRYHGLLTDFMARMTIESVVQTRTGFQPLT